MKFVGILVAFGAYFRRSNGDGWFLGVVLCVNVGGRSHGALFRRGRGPCGKVCGVCFFGPLQAKKLVF